MDGTSVTVLMEDIESAYQGKAPEKERYSSLQLCMDEKKRRGSDELPAAKAVYERIFAGVSLDSLPDPEKSFEQGGDRQGGGLSGTSLQAFRPGMWAVSARQTM
jgi:hypothetical protein